MKINASPKSEPKAEVALPTPAIDTIDGTKFPVRIPQQILHMQPSGEVKATLEGHVPAECPNCHHQFWHKLAHVLKDIAVVPAEVAGTILAAGALGDGK